MKHPAYPEYFADPFVWRHEQEWFAVGTGLLEATGEAGTVASALTASGAPGVFSLLRSADLEHWRAAGAALEKLDPEFGDAYWAPEVAFAEGRFWMYYSVGRGDKAHHLRVAVSERPEGPFQDTGTRLTDPFRVPFAIDPCPFRDDDGTWYLFYASDFLDTEAGARAGTGIVVDRLFHMTALEGKPHVVVRPQWDWQLFQRGRILYGARYDWHTVEGPSVSKRLGRYWCLFSAGRWENETYGVDWAVADHPLGPWMHEGQASGARLLRTVPGEILGPGHNSIVAAEDGDRIVYHAWDSAMTARRMFLNRLEWTPEGPRLQT